MNFTSTVGSVSATLLLASILIGALVWFIVRRFVRPGKGRLPPGPLGLPFVGITPFLEQNPQLKVTEWGKKYGNVFSFYMGRNLTLVLNDYDAIKAGYVDQAEVFSGRPNMFITRLLSRGYHGVIATEGAFWREQRRFLMRSFHELGVGKSRFEQICTEEAQCLVQALLTCGKNAKPFDPRCEIGSSVANIIVGLTFGIRYENRQDPKLRRFLDNQHFQSALLNQAGPLQVLPFLRHFPPFRAAFQKFTEVVQFGRDIVEPEVLRLEKEYDPKQDPTCVVEFFLQKRANDFGTDAAALARAEKDQFVNLINIITNVQVLFSAGTETSVTTLTWCILFLIRYPNIQKRCYDEIAEHVGNERPVNWDDRGSLPYIEAFLYEVWRRANIVPLGVMRRTMEDTKLNGYFIPKGTWLIPNMWNVHRDSRYWDEPLKFNPERFIAQPKSARGTVGGLTNIPFSIGKRQCTGEGIARMEIFIFLANLIQQIEFYQTEGEKLPSEDEFITGVTVQPAYGFNVCVRPRVS